MRATRWIFLLSAVLALALFAAACSDDDDDDGDTEADTTTEASADTDADDDAADDATEGDDDAAADDGAADDDDAMESEGSELTALLDGLSCTGNWENLTFGSTGAFAASAELGGGGGNLTLDLGGNVFGGTGGTVTLPFTIEGSELVVAGDGGFLGAVDVRLPLDGSATGSLTAPPALGDAASVTVTEFSLTADRLRVAVDIDFGTGGDPAQSVVDVPCGG